MKIGIDAKWYFEGPASGKRVIRALVDHLLKAESSHEFFIFLNRNHKGRPFSNKSSRVTLCYVWAGNNMLSNVFVLPFHANRYKLDALLYQNFISPFGAGNKIAYVHDALFLSNPEYYTVYERLYFSPLKILAQQADAIITVSEEEKKRLLKFNFAAHSEKISVAHHGVDNSFVPKESLNTELFKEVVTKYKLPDKFLLFVGRLNLRKNIDTLLRAIPLLKDEKIPLVIVGADEWKKSNHARIIEELGIAKRIHFTGAIYNELNQVYAAATVFCFPSYAESFGLPPLEAMASGVPVVVSNTTSLPEICGDAGNYVDPHDPQAIASMIDSLLEDQTLYLEKRAKGLVQSQKFTWERAAQQVLQCIEGL